MYFRDQVYFQLVMQVYIEICVPTSIVLLLLTAWRCSLFHTHCPALLCVGVFRRFLDRETFAFVLAFLIINQLQFQYDNSFTTFKWQSNHTLHSGIVFLLLAFTKWNYVSPSKVLSQLISRLFQVPGLEWIPERELDILIVWFIVVTI